VARGDIVTIADGATALRPLADAAQSLVVNNPNNGRVYVAADELPTKLFFDYLVQPNTSARLPGLFRETVGVLYQDLTGAGTAGQVELYRSNRVVDAPEYGPLGSATSTSFANVDLAQVATPAAPASGFSRLFASAVDQQLWYELPSGVLIPVSQQAKLQLTSTASTDIFNATPLTTGAWTDITSAVSFNVDDASSVVSVQVQLSMLVSNTAGSLTDGNVRVSIDAGAVTRQLSGFGYASGGAAQAGGGIVSITGLAAGAHTVKLQYLVSSSTAYLRAASNGSFEFLAIQVMEYKR
jgi:hypothetical protein